MEPADSAEQRSEFNTEVIGIGCEKRAPNLKILFKSTSARRSGCDALPRSVSAMVKQGLLRAQGPGSREGRVMACESAKYLSLERLAAN